MMTMSCVHLTPPMIILAPRKQRKLGYQNLIGHLLNLLGLALDLVFQLSLPTLHNLQPFHLVLQSLPAILHAQWTQVFLSLSKMCPQVTRSTEHTSALFVVDFVVHFVEMLIRLTLRFTLQGRTDDTL